MGAELRIEGEEVVKLAEELAALRKMSVPDLVAGLLKSEIEKERDRQERMRKIRELSHEINQHMLEPTTSDHSWLYDENGFPA